MRRSLAISSALALAALLVAAAVLAGLERSGPAAVDLELSDGTPATLYLPEAPARFGLPPPAPEGRRPPVVLVVHGYGGDRRLMGLLARQLARNGYAALAIDLPGHGGNRRPFPLGGGRAGGLRAPLRRALDFVRSLPHVDATRVALLGHSMGAGAVLDLATYEPALDATVLVSGGWRMLGPYRPPNALFLWGEKDLAPLRERARELVAQLAGVRAIVPGRTYGDPAQGTAVRGVEVGGANHLSVLWARETAREVIAWLDGTYGRERAVAPLLGDPRLRWAAAGGLLWFLLLPAAGALLARLGPPPIARPSPDRRAAHLLRLGLALALTLPLAGRSPFEHLFGVATASALLGQLATAGLGLLALGSALGRLRSSGQTNGLGRALVVAVGGWFVLAALLAPFSRLLHDPAPTPERAAAALLAALALFPFFLSFELGLRYGPVASATLLASLGRLELVAAPVVGVALGWLPEAMLLLVPGLVLQMLAFEVLATALHAHRGSIRMLALLEALALGWGLTLGLPIRW